MNPGEATRQFQLALEHRRTSRGRFADVLTMRSEAAALDAEVADAEQAIYDAIVDDGVSRLFA